MLAAGLRGQAYLGRDAGGWYSGGSSGHVWTNGPSGECQKDSKAKSTSLEHTHTHTCCHDFLSSLLILSVAMAQETNHEKHSINLNVISPSSPPVTFHDISLTTSISELKSHISQSSPAHPPVGSQRLIYRGHPLIQGDRTLKDILSQDVVSSVSLQV